MSQISKVLPQSDRDPAHMQGHWVLARVGKRVLRPGGEELTKSMLAHTPLQGRDVVEFAPGLGRTTRLILDQKPASYHGVDRDPQVVDIIAGLTAGAGIPATVTQRDASDTGLETASTDAVVGEAMLTMQSDRGKRAIIAEAARVLRPGGVYAIHELGLTPDDLSESTKDEVRKALARAIKVNARPLTEAEWRTLLESEGFEIVWAGRAPMALLDMRRNIADEGIGGVMRIMRNLIREPELRARVLDMRRVFHEHRDELTAVAIVARKAG